MYYSEKDMERMVSRAVGSVVMATLLPKRDIAQSSGGSAFNALSREISKPSMELNRDSSENAIAKAAASSSLYDSRTIAAPPLKKPKEAPAETVGKGWFDMKPLAMDENLKRDVKLIQMRNYMDPKRFYKNPDKPGTILHVGTVIESKFERANRLTRKERRQSITEEILADASIKSYTKRKYMDIQSDKSRKRKTFKTIRKQFSKKRH